MLRHARHDKTEKNVRATRCSVYMTRRLQKESLISCERNSLEQVYECARILQSGCHIGFAKSLQPSLFSPLVPCGLAIGDLALGCLGVRATESLDVRVATNFVKMMKRKRVARNKSSNFDTSIPILLAVLHRMVLASFCRSSE